jgi:mycothiol synthase
VTIRRVPGLTTRTANRSDVAAITALIGACEVANDGVAEVHPTDVEQSLDLAGDEAGVILVEGPDQLVGWATVADGRAEANVHPAWRGRGIGSALLAWTEGHALASGFARVSQVVTNSDRGAHLLFESTGYRIHHTSWVLAMKLGKAAPEVVVPSGITILRTSPKTPRLRTG